LNVGIITQKVPKSRNQKGEKEVEGKRKKRGTTRVAVCEAELVLALFLAPRESGCGREKKGIDANSRDEEEPDYAQESRDRQRGESGAAGIFLRDGEASKTSSKGDMLAKITYPQTTGERKKEKDVGILRKEMEKPSRARSKLRPQPPRTKAFDEKAKASAGKRVYKTTEEGKEILAPTPPPWGGL